MPGLGRASPPEAGLARPPDCVRPVRQRLGRRRPGEPGCFDHDARDTGRADSPRIMQRLSPRQEQIVVRIALGDTDKEIALQLGISERTVRTHLERLYRSLGVHNRAGAVAVCLTRGGMTLP